MKLVSLLFVCISCASPSRSTPDLAWWLRRSERSVYSQNGEDGLLFALIDVVEEASGVQIPSNFVEFGVQDGFERNTRHLEESRGYTGLLLDGTHADARRNLYKRFVTAENINSILIDLQAPETLGVLCVDLDYNDWHVWRSILEAGLFRPVVVIIEYNSSIGPAHALVVPYLATGSWDGSHFYGASLAALAALGQRHGYALAACDSSGTNAFFVDTRWAGWAGWSEAKFSLTLPTIASAYQRAAYTDSPPSSHAEHDEHLGLAIDVGSSFERLSCPLSEVGSSHRHVADMEISLCAEKFVARHGLSSGMGCDAAGGQTCVVSLLTRHLSQRRWLHVGGDGELAH